jgi:uncharacterized protein
MKTSVQVVQEMYGAFGRGDVGGVLETLAEDVHWLVHGPPDVPLSGARRGRAETAGFFRLLAEQLEVQEFALDHVMAEGDRVTVLGHERMRVRGTGLSYRADWVHVFTVHDARICRFVEYTDTAAMAAAFRAAA